MIVITAQVINANSPAFNRELGRVVIINDGEGTWSRGNYDAYVLRRGLTEDTLFFERSGKGVVVAKGRVENYPRLSYNIWKLVLRSLVSAFPSEKRKLK